MTNIMCTEANYRNHSALGISKQHEQNKKTDVSKTIWISVDAVLEDVSVAETIP